MTTETVIPKTRREQQREETAEEILAIARRMMRADGVAALSFNAIARELGLRPPSLYTYFPSKNAIYDELFRRGFIEFGRRMEQRPDVGGSFEAQLQGTMATYLRFAQENPELYQLMFQRPVPDFAPSEEAMAVSLAILERSRRQIGAVLERDGIAPGLPVDQAGDLLIALTHGLTELHLANNPDLPVGHGRFGQLIPQAAGMVLKAWGITSNKKQATENEDSG